MDYLATFIFVVIVTVGGWYYGCKINTWCGMEAEGVPLTEVLSEAGGDALATEEGKSTQENEQDDEKDEDDASENVKKDEGDDKERVEDASEDKKSEACSEEYFTKDIRPNGNNDKAEVIKLEKFLNKYEGEKLIAGGVYDGTDQAAVKRFQEKYKADILEPAGLTEPSGMVLDGTRKKLNEIYCAKKK